MKLDYVLVCRDPLENDPVAERIRIGRRHWIIIPYSNSQAHRLADRYCELCTLYLINDVSSLIEIAKKLAEIASSVEFDYVSINEHRTYVYEHEETVVDNEIMNITYLALEGGGCYLAKHKRSRDIIEACIEPL